MNIEPLAVMFLMKPVYDRDMREGPDIALVAALIGDPARANMLIALMDGRALTASELAIEAGITKQTASMHLARMDDAGLIEREKQGRHSYVRLSGQDVADVLETLIVVAQTRAGKRTRPGPKDSALRQARICYDHLAGERGVWLLDRLKQRGWLTVDQTSISVSQSGWNGLSRLGISAGSLPAGRRPMCRACLDWSERRHHLAGKLGKAIMDSMLDQGWIRRETGSRVVEFTTFGKAEMAKWLD